MKIKTSELTGRALAYTVAQIEGHESRCPWLLEKEGWASWQSYELAWGNPIPRYATNWEVGGPIIDREGIGTRPDTGLNWWVADIKGGVYIDHGPTALIAAMRCFVASKLGDEVDIPKELL